MEVKQADKVNKAKLAGLLHISENDFQMELDKTNNVLSIIFDKSMLQIPQILSAVMEMSEVSDIQIQETELAEIVKEIYSHGVA